MKKTVFVLICTCLVIPFTLQAKKLADLPELMKPQRMVVDGNRLFIVEGTSIYIYSLKDYKLIKKFGKTGEGPGEFKINPFGGPGLVPVAISQYILVNSSGKLSYFTKDGKYIKELKIPPLAVLRPIKDNFIGTGYIVDQKRQELKLCIILFDSKLNKIKQLYQSDVTINVQAVKNLPFDPFTYKVHQEKIFIPDTKDGFIIRVFDSYGKEVYQIKKDYTPLKVDDAYKKRILDWYKNEPLIKNFWEQVKDTIKFKRDFPPIKDIAIDCDKIYVFTYKKQNDLGECIILDLEGKEQKRLFLPLPPDFPLTPICYAIQNDRFYTLVENKDGESWVLDVEEIK
jgi:hypothetical protein